MAITRKRRGIVNFVEPHKDNVYNTTTSLSDFSNSPITPATPYFFVSKLPECSTTSTNASFFTGRKMYALMEGEKRIMSWGYSNSYSLMGSSSEAYTYHVYPTHTQYDYPLDKDDYIIQFCMGGDTAGFVTAKGYVYLAGYQDDDGWIGTGDNNARYAFTRVSHANSVTTSTYSSGGAVGANSITMTAANANIQIGQQVCGLGVPTWTTVTGIAGATIQLSNNLHTQAAGLYSFGQPWGPDGIKAKKLYIPFSSYNSSAERWALILDESGNVYSCGYNGHGQLGNGTATTRNFWSRITALSNIKEVYVSNYTAMALTFSGQLYGWAYNAYGQLGIGNTTNQLTPVIVANNADKAFLSTHDYDTNFYISNGVAYAAGSNYFGALGINVSATTNTTTWTPVNTTNIGTRRITDIKAVGTGTYNVAWFYCDDGSIFSSGYNGNGQLGDGTLTDRSIPVQLIIPSGFPKTTKIICGGGSTSTFLTGISMETGRMWSVGSWNYGSVGQVIGEPTATWAVTSTSARSQYPAREVTSPPPVEDGTASFKDFYVTSPANSESLVFALLTDGTLWVRGYGFINPKGSRLSLNYAEGNYMLVGSTASDTGWKQVEF